MRIWVILILTFSFLKVTPDAVIPKDNELLHNYLMLKIHILNPLEKKFGKLCVTSLFRTWPYGSQHILWQAVDIDDYKRDYTNRDLFEFVRDSLSYDQLIRYNRGKEMSHIHVSYRQNNRNEVLRCYRWNKKKWYKKLN